MQNASLRAFVSFLLLCLLLSTPGYVATPARAADPAARQAPSVVANANPFSATPPALVANDVPLGQTRQVELLIANGGAAAQAPVLYTAWPVPPPGAAGLQGEPQALRQVELPDQAARVDPQIARDLAAADDGRAEVLVFLADQPDLGAAYAIADWQARGEFVYRTLTAHADQRQRPIRAWLEARGRPYRAFWIVNALAVEASAADIQALAGRADVALVRANYAASLPAAPALLQSDPATIGPASCKPDAKGVCWNVRQIGADRVWADFGVSGQGVTVASIDSGVDYRHPALAEQYRGYRGPGLFDHDYNWFDPQGRSAAPNDANTSSHGTHTMGTMVGRGASASRWPAVGVAPGARWIAAQGCRGTTCTDSDLLAAAQWLLAPTDASGANPRPDLRPQIVNNSWAGGGNNQSYVGYVAAWRAAGIFPVFAAGNYNTVSCGTIGSPGDYANVVAVGSTDEDERISAFSAIGPTFDGRIKPDLVAPGRSIASTVAMTTPGLPNYGTLSGTSMATPQVAATAALLMAANPDLVGDYDALYALLIGSARPRIDANFSAARYPRCAADSEAPNNIYGYGRLDAYAALAQARVETPWLKLPAAVAAIEPGAAETITVTLDTRHVPGPGVYNARLLIGTGDLSQAPLAVTVTMTVAADDSRAIVQGSVVDAETGTPLNARVAVADGPRVETDASGGFAVTLSPRADPYLLSAAATGYRTESVTLTLTAGLEMTQVFSLTADLPRLQVSTAPLTATLNYDEEADRVLQLRNSGTQPLHYSLSVPAEQFGVWRSDEPGGPAPTWIEPPTGATRLLLSDNGAAGPLPLSFEFSFYGVRYRQVYVSANGLLSLGAFANQIYRDGCLPAAEAPFGAIAPLRADLNPALGGNVSYAEVDEGFLVTFDQMPLAADPAQTFTFQVLLTHDSRIRFNYRELGALPPGAAVGIQRNTVDLQALGCGRTAPISAGQAIELRPQPNPQFWVVVRQMSGEIAPGGEALAPIVLNWVRPASPGPYRGVVLLQTTDPRRPLVRLPVELTANRLPYEFRLPVVRR